MQKFDKFLFLLGHLQSRVVYYLMNIHVLPRTIYLTRVSEKFCTLSCSLLNSLDMYAAE